MSIIGGKSFDRLVIVVVSIWVVFCGGVIAQRVAFNPMHARFNALEDRLGQVSDTGEIIESPLELNDRKLRERILTKEALWEDLIPPPPPPEKKEKAPDLDALVKGIRPSAREQISNAQGVRIRIRTESDNVGRFYGVGDKIKGLTITEITDKEVIFEAVVNKKEYSVPVKRR